MRLLRCSTICEDDAPIHFNSRIIIFSSRVTSGGIMARLWVARSTLNNRVSRSKRMIAKNLQPCLLLFSWPLEGFLPLSQYVVMDISLPLLDSWGCGRSALCPSFKHLDSNAVLACFHQRQLPTLPTSWMAHATSAASLLACLISTYLVGHLSTSVSELSCSSYLGTPGECSSFRW